MENEKATNLAPVHQERIITQVASLQEALVSQEENVSSRLIFEETESGTATQCISLQFARFMEVQKEEVHFRQRISSERKGLMEASEEKFVASERKRRVETEEEGPLFSKASLRRL